LLSDLTGNLGGVFVILHLSELMDIVELIDIVVS